MGRQSSHQTGITIVPTLIIGLGGTGVNVVRQAKGAFHRFFESNNLGAIPDVLRFLAVDSVPLSNPVGETEIDETEYAYLGGVDANLIIEHLDFHPFIQPWWDVDRSKPGHLEDGCRQMRDAGRLIFFHNYRDFRNRLTKQMDILKRREAYGESAQRGYKLRDRANVCIVCSVAGGTGSGLFLDVAYNVRHEARERSAEQAGIGQVGYLVMPQVYLPVLISDAQRQAVQSNGYAALSELEFLNRHPERAREFFGRYPGNVQFNLEGKSGRPFDHTFLIGIRGQEGEGLSSAAQAWESIAEKIFLESVYIGDEVGERESNITVDGPGGPTLPSTNQLLSYSSFSVGAIGVRRDMVLDYCVYRLATDAVEGLLSPASTANLPALPEDLKISSMVEGIMKGVLDAHPLPEARPPEAPESLVLLDLLNDTEKRLADVVQRRERDVKDAVKVHQDKIRGRFDTDIRSIVVERGVDSLLPYLESWQERLQDCGRDIVRIQQSLQATRSELKARFDKDRKDLDELREGPGIKVLVYQTTAKRRHRREQLYQSSADALQEMAQLDLRLDAVRQIDAAMVRSILGNSLDDHRGLITRTIDHWNQVQTVLRSVRSALQNQLGELSRSINNLNERQPAYVVARDISVKTEELESLFLLLRGAVGQDGRRQAGAFEVEPVVEVVFTLEESTETLRSNGRTAAAKLASALIGAARTVCLPAFGSVTLSHDEDDENVDLTLIQAAQAIRGTIHNRLHQHLTSPGGSDALFEHNAPLWTFPRAYGEADSVEPLDVILAETSDAQNIAGRPLTLAKTGGPSPEVRIVASGDPGVFASYRAAYGLPLAPLGGILDMWEQYQHRRLGGGGNGAGRASLHICKQWNAEMPANLFTKSDGTYIDEVAASFADSGSGVPEDSPSRAS